MHWPRICALLPVVAGLLGAQDANEFFEKRIRPVLVQNCYACHSGASATPLGGLRVDTREGLGKVLVPGDPEASRVLQVLRYDSAVKMPPSGKLPPEQIEDVRRWIATGAIDPRIAETKAGVKGWAFQPVANAPVPVVKDKAWVRTPIDAFVLSKLEAAGKRPGAPADKRTLLRRVTFDLIGLPPTPDELDAFLADRSPQAFAKVVDRLLASPHYGERWGRHWLDLVRYAETNGHEYDNDKMEPWRYRDYVIRAFNNDLPYNQFVREHLAGDLLSNKRTNADGTAWESPIATSYLWFGEVLNSATDSVKSRADEVDNQIDVTGKAFLGLTIACARCHDHKFDPIPTADYYSLAGVFHSTSYREAVMDTPARAGAIHALSLKLRTPAPAKERGPFDSWIASGEAFGDAPFGAVADSGAAGSDRFVGTLTSRKLRTGKELYLHVLVGGSKGDASLKERGPLRFTIVADGYKGQHIVPDGDRHPKWRTLKLTFERERTIYFEIVDRTRDGHIVVQDIVFSDSKEPPTTPAIAVAPMPAHREMEDEVPPSTFAMVAEDLEPHDVRIHLRGSHTNLGEVAPRRFLKAVAGDSQRPVSGSGRLYWADWLADRRNPLTARVMVNRIWQHHFGRGLVRSVDNFGVMGDKPSDPELLDYLATRFMDEGWSVKKMHRLLLLSSSYAAEGQVRRLDAESLRDSILAVAGTLDTKMYGPSVPPFIDKYQDGRGKPASGPLDGDRRRTIYVQVRRNFLSPFLLAFDYPLPISAIGNRGSSTVPSQALILMNNDFVLQQAGQWAEAVSSISDPKDKVSAMYRRAFLREPQGREAADIISFVENGGTWKDVAHVLFNSPEFLYLQ